jgi:aminoglycoside/choline kinase family phosphotransferase/dTDP-glucose pyrophosphorylase
MKAMILSAGLGTRLLPFTRHTPKPLFTINQQPILDRIVEQLHRAGCTALMINTHHLHDQIEKFIAGRSYPIHAQTCYEPEILGTGGAIRNVADFWSEAPLLIINADIVTDIGLDRVYHHHCSHPHPVTMVMHDRPPFNSVGVNREQFVTGFHTDERQNDGVRAMAFTGIHVMDRRVLDYLPAAGPSHIIDAYAQMLQAGEKIKALIVRDHYWQDIGTPASYRTAVLDHMAPAAFAIAFGQPPAGPIQYQPLQGDGSDRRWHRLTADDNCLIMVDHGIRTGDGRRQEVEAFVDIGRHLHATGAAVPQLYLHDTFSGLVFLEDLGDLHLQDAARQANPDQLEHLYRQVIDHWLHMALESGRDFDPGWTWQSARYDKTLILEKECRYFVEAFLNGYLGDRTGYDNLVDEFERLADRALKEGFFGFMHRDLQSRNIMIQGNRIVFIDFQGGRWGPLQYDLASLLIDPYVALPAATQDRLRQYAARALQGKAGVDAKTFLAGYEYCALTRNLQMLGAFAFLSRIKGKRGFEAFIPPAVTTLHRNLAVLRDIRMPRLKRLVSGIIKRVKT